jgi:hypothetical protein
MLRKTIERFLENRNTTNTGMVAFHLYTENENVCKGSMKIYLLYSFWTFLFF